LQKCRAAASRSKRLLYTG